MYPCSTSYCWQWFQCLNCACMASKVIEDVPEWQCCSVADSRFILLTHNACQYQTTIVLGYIHDVTDHATRNLHKQSIKTIFVPQNRIFQIFI